MFELNDTKNTWEYRNSNTWPFIIPGSGSVIVIIIRNLFELCVDIGATEEGTLKTEDSSNPYNISFHRRLLNLHRHRDDILYSTERMVMWFYVLFGTFLMLWKSLYLSLKARESYSRSIKENEYHLFTVFNNGASMLPIKTVQVSTGCMNFTLDCLLIRN